MALTILHDREKIFTNRARSDQLLSPVVFRMGRGIRAGWTALRRSQLSHPVDRGRHGRPKRWVETVRELEIARELVAQPSARFPLSAFRRPRGQPGSGDAFLRLAHRAGMALMAVASASLPSALGKPPRRRSRRPRPHHEPIEPIGWRGARRTPVRWRRCRRR